MAGNPLKDQKTKVIDRETLNILRLKCTDKTLSPAKRMDIVRNSLAKDDRTVYNNNAEVEDEDEDILIVFCDKVPKSN